MCDRKGVIYKGRGQLDQFKSAFAIETKHRKLEDAMKSADVFLGLSAKDVVDKNMIKSMMSLYKNSFPTIVLTKLDESQISAEELSIFAELKCKIGILSGSRSIINSLAFANSEVLAQYMKDTTL